ncbi:MAG: hypothetical protein ACLGH0_05485, partial [Thermoanaerobaculia bacterium]
AFETYYDSSVELNRWFTSVAKPPVTTSSQAVQWVDGTMNTLIQDARYRSEQKLPVFDRDVVTTQLLTGRGAIGIYVIGKQTASHPGIGALVFRDNHIYDYMIGIQAGYGMQILADGDHANHTQISGNEVRVATDPYDDSTQAYGIINGSSDTVHIFANTLETQARANGNMGIFLIGHYGAQAIIRDNAMANFQSPFAAQTYNVPTPRIWRAVTNVSTGGGTYSFGQFFNENNV